MDLASELFAWTASILSVCFALGAFTWSYLLSKKNAELVVKVDRFDLALKNTNDVVFDWDCKEELFLSENFFELLGHEPFVGSETFSKLRSLIHPDDFVQFNGVLQEHLNWRTPLMIDIRIMNYLMDYRWFAIRGQAQFDSSDMPFRLVGSLTEITEKKEAEREILFSEAKFRALYEGMSDAVLLMDKNGFFDGNPAALKIFGFMNLGELSKKMPWDLSPERQPHGVWSLESMQEYLRQSLDGSHVRFEWHYRRQDGSEFPAEVVLNPVMVSGLPVVQMVVRDISEQRLQQAKLTAASKMSTLGEMAGGIAHEINNPLAIIHGNAGTLLMHAENGEVPVGVVKKAAEKILATTDRIAKIVRGLRSFARDGEQDPFESVFVHQIVSETLEFCQARFRNNDVELRVIPVPQDLLLECRAVQISQVLLNLLNNAFDAVHATQPSDANSPWVELQVRDQNDFVEIWVTDSGLGIPKEIADKIMQPFFTTKEVGKGTGLGLSIASGIARSHNGSFHIDHKCKNTRFVLRLSKKQSTSQFSTLNKAS